MNEQPEESNKLGKLCVRWVCITVALIPLVLIAIYLLYYFK